MTRMFGQRISRRRGWSVGLALLMLATLIPVVGAAHEPGDEVDRFIQFGTPGNDAATSIAFNEDSAFVAGTAGGALPDQDYAESGDAFVRKYDADWNECWTRQFGTLYIDTANGVAVDDTGVYVVGFTAGALDEQSSQGQGDAYIRKYDLDGNELWTRQFGTDASDEATGVAVGSSGVYVSGATSGTFPGETNAGGLSDAFVRAYDSDGNTLWTHQFGTIASDAASSIATIDTSIYVAGYLGPNPGETTSTQAFALALDATGMVEWSQTFGTDALDSATSVAATDDSVYVAGYTLGTFPGQTALGSFDAFVRRYDRSGSEVWTRQFGTDAWDQATDVTAFGTGIVVAGWTEGVLPGQTGLGMRDAFARRIDADGNDLRSWQFGTDVIDTGSGVAARGTTIAVAGNAANPVIGEGGSPNSEAFVAILDDSEPATPSVVAMSPAADQVDVETASAVSITFSEAMDAESITAESFTLHDASGASVPGSVVYDDASRTATYQPDEELTAATTYTATVVGGPDGARSESGNPLAADYSWEFTTIGETPETYRLWSDDATPSIPNANDPFPIEVGVRFWSDVAGVINGIHFYKGSAEPAERTVSLWTAGGRLLGRATAMTSASTGWQYVAFDQPIRIEAGRRYIASYHTPIGDYAVDPYYFATAGVDNPPLHTPMNTLFGGNGVRKYSAMPVFAFWSRYASNYWVDVSLTPLADESD